MEKQNSTTIPIFKVVIVGDTSVGKTCLMKRFIEGIFTEHEDATLGAQFYSMKLKAEYSTKPDKVDDDKKSRNSGKTSSPKNKLSPK